MIVRRIHNDTFFFDVTLVWPVTPAEFSEFVRTQFDPEFTDVDDFKAICAQHKADDCIIGFKQWEFSDSDLGNLVHETLHATKGMLKSRGIKMSDATEEVFCYLQNSLFEMCLKEMRESQ